MPHVQHTPKTFSLRSNRSYMLLLEGKHVLIKPGEPGLIQLSVNGCGPVCNPFHINGACDPPDAVVTAKVTAGSTVIHGQPNPQYGAGFDFEFNGVPAGTYMLEVDGCDPPEVCEIIVEECAQETVPELQLPDGR
jgi:hypothetical protein